MPKINFKDPKVIAGIAAAAVIVYLLYRHFHGSGSSGAGATSTPGQDQAGSLGYVDPGTGAGGGIGGIGGQPVDTSQFLTTAQEQQDLAALGQNITGQIPSAVTAALAQLGITGPQSTSAAATGGNGSSPLTGPLNSLPIAAQIALVQGGLADSSQLGPRAAQIYAAGGTRAPARKPGPVSSRGANAAADAGRHAGAQAGKAGHEATQAMHASGHATHKAGNAAHGTRSHAQAHPVVHAPHPEPPRKPAPPRPAQRRKRVH